MHHTTAGVERHVYPVCATAHTDVRFHGECPSLPCLTVPKQGAYGQSPVSAHVDGRRKNGMKRPQAQRIAKRGRKMVRAARKRRTFMGGSVGKSPDCLRRRRAFMGDRVGKSPDCPHRRRVICGVQGGEKGECPLSAIGGGQRARGRRGGKRNARSPYLRADSGAPERGGQGRELLRLFLWLTG